MSPVSLVGSIVHFELTPHDNGTLLTLDHTLADERTPLADVLGGWNAHLDELSEKFHLSAFAAVPQSLTPDFLVRCKAQSKMFAMALSVNSVQ
jgi:hypothetical protein